MASGSLGEMERSASSQLKTLSHLRFLMFDG